MHAGPCGEVLASAIVCFRSFVFCSIFLDLDLFGLIRNRLGYVFTRSPFPVRRFSLHFKTVRVRYIRTYYSTFITSFTSACPRMSGCNRDIRASLAFARTNRMGPRSPPCAHGWQEGLRGYIPGANFGSFPAAFCDDDFPSLGVPDVPSCRMCLAFG